MVHTPLGTILRHVRKLAASDAELPRDDRLLESFAVRGDEDAFAELVRRHGSMVLGVCRRVLQHQQDAEDVFQATFLILARKAETVRHQQALGSWLHKVAFHLAVKTRAQAARRRTNERREVAMLSDDAFAEVTWREMRGLVDEELGRLPMQQRQALVLCYLEGRTHEEAARLLGWTLGTLRRRLSQGRELLRVRLVRRGLTLSAALVTSSIAQSATPIGGALLETTIAAAVGKAVPGQIAALVESGLSTLFVAKSKSVTAVLMLVGVLAGGSALIHGAPEGAERPRSSPSAPTQAPPKNNVREVSGRVVDPDGKAVANARLYSTRPGKDPTDVAIDKLGVTDMTGRFSLELPGKEGPPIALIAMADGLGLDWVEIPNEDKARSVTLRLVKDVPIRGRVVTTEGKPLAGVSVQLSGVIKVGRLDDFLAAYQRDTRLADQFLSARLLAPLHKVLSIGATDKDGRFEVTGLGVDRLLGVDVQSTGLPTTSLLVVSRPGIDLAPLNKAIAGPIPRNARGPVPLALLNGPTFDCVVEPGWAIEGTVREAGTSKPVARATITVTGGSFKAVTDAQGRYRIAGLPKAKMHSLYVYAPKQSSLMPQRRDVPAPEELAPIKVDLTLVRGVVLTGRVTEKASGNAVRCFVHHVPLPENKNAAAGLNHQIDTVDTGVERRFRVVVTPGPGVLLARAVPSHVRIDGQPLNPYTQAQFDSAELGRVMVTESPDGLRMLAVAKDAAAILSFENACKVVEVKDTGGPFTCDLVLERGHTLNVHLRDPQGQPLSGVIVEGLTAASLDAFTLKTGECKVYALDPTRPRRLLFVHPARKLAAEATVRGDEKEPPTVTLRPAGSALGRALDSDGQPIAGADVYPVFSQRIYNEGYRHLLGGLPPRTDKDGRFRLEGLVPGQAFHIRLQRARMAVVLEGNTLENRVESGSTLKLGDLHQRLTQ
jgi:RNA polymerase sigma factor (sigma-70 family)